VFATWFSTDPALAKTAGAVDALPTNGTSFLVVSTSVALSILDILTDPEGWCSAGESENE
jgi:hypothetical protein